MRHLFALGIAFAATAFVQAQAPGPKVEFEVATVKKSPPPGADSAVTAGLKLDGAQLRIGALTLRDYIGMAYRVKVYQIAGPDWIATERFDIAAKLPAGTKADQFPAMMQELLADRFGLKFHREPKEMPVYALVLGKNGPKFKESAPDAVRVSNHGGNGRKENMTLTKASMDSLVAGIWNDFGMDRPILDKTGLKRLYDIRLEATPMYRIDDNPNAGDITVFSAVQDQLGLRLESQRGSVEVLIVDHIEKPSKN